eukprot:COSAG01_NODE_8972_length_2598_cov_1.786315_1_plen_82_part_00
MICVLLVSDHHEALDAEVRQEAAHESPADGSGSTQLSNLVGLPLALMPSGVKDMRILDIWWEGVKKRYIFSNGAPCQGAQC